MPINLKVIQTNPEARVLLETSIQRRRNLTATATTTTININANTNGESDASECLSSHDVIETVISRDAKAHCALHQVTCLYQQKNKNKTDKAKQNELRLLIKEYEAQYAQTKKEMEQAWMSLPNYIVDIDLDQFNDNDCNTKGYDKESTNEMKVDSSLFVNTGNRLFCLGGYVEHDIFTAVANTKNQHKGILLTSAGMQLYHALVQSIFHWYRTFIDNNKSSVQILQVPQTTLLPVSIAQKRWGDATDQPSNGFKETPFWQSWIEQMNKQVLYDRTLPLQYILQCHGPRLTRNRSKVQNQSTTGRLWYHDFEQSAQCSELQLLIFTGPCLQDDSQPLQINILKSLRLFYQQFLPQFSKTEHSLRISAVEPSGLANAEANCLVLQGFLPSLSRKGINEPITLASVSNLLDYATYPDVRHGSSSTGLSQQSNNKQYVHVLVGTLLRPACLEWVLQQCDEDAHQHGIRVPPGLASGDDTIQLDTFLRYQKRVRRGKHGQRIVESLETTPHEQPSAAAAANVSTAKEQLESQQQRRIRLEANACPFDFLPFYYR